MTAAQATTTAKKLVRIQRALPQYACQGRLDSALYLSRLTANGHLDIDVVANGTKFDVVVKTPNGQAAKGNLTATEVIALLNR